MGPAYLLLQVLVGSVALALLARGLLPGWLVGLVVARDSFLFGAHIVMRMRQVGWKVRLQTSALTCAMPTIWIVLKLRSIWAADSFSESKSGNQQEIVVRG